jgi:hypothetical protein
MCSAHKDEVEIKCMGSVGGKTPTEPKIYSFFSSLRHGKIDLCTLFIYNMGDKIESMSMSVVF